MSKKDLSERDICTKYITPALVQADWDVDSQIREEVFFTKGRIIVRGKHDRTGQSAQKETELPLDAFPKPDELWAKYRAWKGLAPAEEQVVLQDYHDDGSGKEPRYYQRIAINKAMEAIAKGQQRILLVMATGTGKTYTAFQIIWRLWKAGGKNASFSSPTATCSLTRRWSTTSARSAPRWRS